MINYDYLSLDFKILERKKIKINGVCYGILEMLEIFKGLLNIRVENIFYGYILY